MNVGRGLFRLWLVITAIWGSLVWLLMHDASGLFQRRRPQRSRLGYFPPPFRH